MKKLPLPTAERIARYLRVCLNLIGEGKHFVYSQELADLTGTNSNGVRKDISMLSKITNSDETIQGLHNKGYKIEHLIKYFKIGLGIETTQNIILVGCGNIGMAMLNYNGFGKRNFEIVAAFDVSPEKIGTTTNGVMCYDISELESYLKKETTITIAMLATPKEVAIDTANRLVESGITSILNFVPIKLKCKESVIEMDIDILLSLCVLSHLGQ